MTTFIKITPENEELYHFGVVGMRWGQRKNYSTLVSPSKSEAKAAKAEAKVARKADKKEFNKQYNKAVLDMYRHPIISAKEQGRYVVRNKTVLLNTTARAKELNDAVDKEVAKSKERNAARRAKVVSKMKDLKNKPVSKKPLLSDEDLKAMDDAAMRIRINTLKKQGRNDAARELQARQFTKALFGDTSPTADRLRVRMLESQGRTDAARERRTQSLLDEIFGD